MADGAGPSEAAVRLARHALAETLGVDQVTIEIVSVEPATWPGPGVQCAQTLTDETRPRTSGHRVRLRLGSAVFEVRVAEGTARVCGIGTEIADLEPGRIEPGLREQIAQAKLDLAARLHTTPDTIEVLEATSVVWRDSSIGCPQPGMAYLQVLTSGTRIRLRIGQAVFHYHGAGTRPPFFCERPAKIDPLPGAPVDE